jgi:hypothetical protein
MNTQVFGKYLSKTHPTLDYSPDLPFFFTAVLRP